MPYCDNCSKEYDFLRLKPLPNAEFESLCVYCSDDESLISRTWRRIMGNWSGVRQARYRHNEISHMEKMWKELGIPNFSSGVWRGKR
jgi:hypothetical protein